MLDIRNRDQLKKWLQHRKDMIEAQKTAGMRSKETVEYIRGVYDGLLEALVVIEAWESNDAYDAVSLEFKETVK